MGCLQVLDHEHHGTRVDAGGLDIRKGLRSDLTIANGATVWASGAFGGNVGNSGRFFNGASVPATIAGNFIQSSTGNLGIWLGSTLRPGALREDRILHEIHATGGDVRRICDLFGLTISGATRYLNTVEHPDLTTEGDRAH